MADNLMDKHVKIVDEVAIINAEGMHYQQLNALLRKISTSGVKTVELYNVYGQRYIGTGLKSPLEIKIYGTPGNDLGAFMDGQKIFVYGNAQDGCGNTMNNGLIVIYGNVGDVLAYSMRGGKIFVKGDAGFRAGIHMKGYGNRNPTVVIGGAPRDFLGEYMAGGIMLVLGLNNMEEYDMKFAAIGMHGGSIYVRGGIKHVGKEAESIDVNEEDLRLIRNLVEEYSEYFNPEISVKEIMSDEFTKIVPLSHRPYGKLYI